MSWPSVAKPVNDNISKIATQAYMATTLNGLAAQPNASHA